MEWRPYFDQFLHTYNQLLRKYLPELQIKKTKQPDTQMIPLVKLPLFLQTLSMSNVYL